MLILYLLYHLRDVWLGPGTDGHLGDGIGEFCEEIRFLGFDSMFPTVEWRHIVAPLYIHKFSR